MQSFNFFVENAKVNMNASEKSSVIRDIHDTLRKAN